MFIGQVSNPAADLQASIQQTAEQTAKAVKWALIIGIAVVLLYLATKK